MEISPLRTPQIAQSQLSAGPDQAQAGKLQTAGGTPSEVRKAFDSFVGESFYSQMLSAMRKTTGKAAYFHGGRAEEAFRGQLDQTLAAKMAESNAADFTGPMFDLFQLNRA
jgi:flagellar protein FlgJ